MNFPVLSPSEVFLLVDPNHSLPLIVKENVLGNRGIDLQEVVKEVIKFASEKEELFQVTKIGRNENLVVDTTIRGDLRCWLTPKLCETENLLNILLLVKALIKLCSSVKSQLQLNGDYSIQLTKYPGNGSRYVKHRDTFFDQANPKNYRKLTAIYYLNNEFEGGNLRVFLPNPIAEKVVGSSYMDIDPKLDTLVLFRSEFIEHEVLPSFKDRFAITVWASSSSPFDLKPTPSPVTRKYQPFMADNTLHFPLPVDENKSIISASKSIFVSMVNYCDSEGPNTLIDLFRKAKNPSRVFVGYVYQGHYEDEGNIIDSLLQDLQEIIPIRNIRRLYLSKENATGPCFARHLAGTLWQQEDYYLQIDSHMRFCPQWDEYLIQLLEEIKDQELITKPILTTYPLAYFLPNDIPRDIQPTVLVPWKFDDNGLLRQKSVRIEMNRSEEVPYFRSTLWAAGFSFSDASVLSEVPYSCHLPYLFFGEEMIMALRLFSHNYRFFAPGQATVYHLYSRKHRPTINNQLNDYEIALKAQSIAVVKEFLCPDHTQIQQEGSNSLLSLNRQRFGLGSYQGERSFEKSIGVSFSSQSIDPILVSDVLPSAFHDCHIHFANSTSIEEEEIREFQENLVKLMTSYSDGEKSDASTSVENKALSNILRFIQTER